MGGVLCKREIEGKGAAHARGGRAARRRGYLKNPTRDGVGGMRQSHIKGAKSAGLIACCASLQPTNKHRGQTRRVAVVEHDRVLRCVATRGRGTERQAALCERRPAQQ